MKLYYTPGASSLAPHIVLREIDRRFDLERVDRVTHLTASGRDYREVNPTGDVPALEVGDELLTEVPAILQYLADLDLDRRLVPPAATMARYHVEEWLSFIARRLSEPFGWLHDRAAPDGFAALARGRIARSFEHVQNALADRAYLLGETFTIADAFLYVVLQWCEHEHIDLVLWPNLDEYEFRIAQRPAVIAAMAAEGIVGRHRATRRTA